MERRKIEAAGNEGKMEDGMRRSGERWKDVRKEGRKEEKQEDKRPEDKGKGGQK